MTTLTPELELAQIISTPSRLGVELGQSIWGMPWKPYPFLLEIEEAVVEACIDDTKQDWFIVNCPNQVGKTSWAGILLAFWYIGMFPDKQVIFISYSDAYSMDYGRMVRDLFKAHGQRLFGLTVDSQNDAAGDWKLKGHPAGGMLSVGIGGQITGRQGHLVIIDDVLRTMVDAASPATKEAHWKEWQGTIFGRRQPGSVYLVTATRLAEDDLSGRLKDQMRKADGKGIQWREMSYPGICEPPDDYDGDPDDYRDSLGRKVGDPLETRFSQPTDTIESNWWQEARDALDNPALFDCMVQQNPKRVDAGMFPESRWKFELRSEWPVRYNRVRAWDLAATPGSGDFTTGSLLGRDSDNQWFIEDVVREQLSAHDGIEKVKATALLDGPAVPIVIEEEKGGAGKNLVEFYRRELPGYQVHPAPTSGTKEQRATPYSILQQGRHFTLPEDQADEEWVKTWVKEHAGMMGDGRRPRHDDTVDTAAHGVNFLLEYGIADIIDPNEVMSDPAVMMEIAQDEENYGVTEYLTSLGLPVAA